MNYVVILLIVGAAGLVLFSLARGLMHFARAGEQIQHGANADGPTANHLAQNKMMFARVKWQAITIILLVVLGMLAAAK
ncbi:MAG: hypothetical protein ACKOUM_07530 [Sphingopyxis sp.]